MKMRKALIFDFGNVLRRFDNRVLCRQVASLTDGRTPDQVWQFVYETEFDGKVNRGHYTSAEMYEIMGHELGIRADYETFARAWNEIFWPQAGIERILDAVQGRYRTVVLSNINPMHAAYIRQTVPLLARFDAQVFSCEAGFAKPDPEVYAEAVRRAGCLPHECLFTDDIAAYVEAAHAAGLHAFQFTTVADAEEQLREFGVLPS